MKEVLYFSMACDENKWNLIQSESLIKGSISPIVFDRLLIKGLSNIDELNLKIYSFPSIPSYPNHRKIFWNFLDDNISDEIKTTWLPFVNIHIFKQFSHFFSSLLIAFHWALKHRSKKGIIIIYSQYLPISLSVILISRIFFHKSLCIVTDLPEYMFLNRKHIPRYSINGIKIFQRLTNRIQREFDKYVFLTEELNCRINYRKVPYTIIEGIGDPLLFETVKTRVKTRVPNSIMYAGSLNKAVGIETLIELVKVLPINIEIWVFGSGDAESIFDELSQSYKNLKFFGKVSRSEILQKELEASLLLNLRNPADELTLYSFPSKTIEYMSSGTPLLSTKLKGIPEEYYKYIFTVETYEIEEILQKIISIFKMDVQVRDEKGRRAQEFIRTEKNYIVQTERLFNLIKL